MNAMPVMIPYESVLQRMNGLRMRCVYHNSGAFAFEPAVEVRSVGWVGPPDPSIRAEARPLVRPVMPPYESNLARLLVRAWLEIFPATRAWVMPASHWAYELQFGSREWMPPLLEGLGLDPALLKSRNQADAIEFSGEEVEAYEHLCRGLLEMLLGSDFVLTFPDRGVICRLHHHRQLWWTTPEAKVFDSLDQLVAPPQ
jgi:hypothetical protein